MILIIARLVQGFATGGEYGTSATYMSEAATANRRGFLSSFQYVTLVGGHVLAQFTLLIALHFLDKDALSAWGWRIGFFIGGIAALGANVGRFALDFTVVFAIAYGSWIIGSYAYIAAVTPSEQQKFGIGWSLKLTNEGGFVVALLAGLVLLVFLRSWKITLVAVIAVPAGLGGHLMLV